MFTDGVKATFGSNVDLQIYHDGSNSYIKDTGTGNLRIDATNFFVRNSNGSKLAIDAVDGAEVNLRYNGSKKFETTNTGITVTGTATATTFSGDLNGTINTATTAPTKPNATNDTTVATTAFVQNLIGTIPAGLVFQGTWNADTNTPTLASGTGTTGHFYIVSTEGSTNLDGITDWKVGDWVVFVEQGATDAWQKVDNSSVLDGSGTGNQITKWAGSGTSNTLTDSIITDDGTNVGIGTTAPAYPLDIQSSSTIALRLNNSSNSSCIIKSDNTYLQLQSAGYILANNPILAYQGLWFLNNKFIRSKESDGTWTDILGLDSSNVLKVGTLGNVSSGGDVAFLVSGSEKMRVAANGNVGIGTTSPSAKLEVAGTGNQKLIVNRTDGDNFFIDAQNGQIRLRGSSDIIMGVSGDVLTITNSNVGIGTTAPSEKLHVNGNLELGANPTLYWTSNTLNLQNKSISSIPVVNIKGNVNYGGRLQVEDELGLTTIRLRGDGNSYFNGGKVGIGTTSPSSKLEVISNDNVGTTKIISAYSLSESQSTSLGYNSVIGSYSLALQTLQTQPITFKPNSVEAMRITSSGNVGIGTTSPDADLQVEGSGTGASGNNYNVIISDNSTLNANKGGGIIFRGVYNTGGSQANFGAIRAGKANGNNGNANAYLSLFYSASGTLTEGIRLNESGNVGIGTTSPSSELEINGNVGYTSGNAIFPRTKGIAADWYTSKFDGGLNIDNSVGSSGNTAFRIGYWGGGTFAPNIKLSGGGGNTSYFASGNVGIGTTSPDSLLEIASDSVTDFLKLTSTGGGATPIKLIFEKGTSEQGVIEYNRNGDLEIYNTDADGGVMIDGSASEGADLYVANTGNVGIGTTSPSTNLEVVTSDPSNGIKGTTNTGIIWGSFINVNSNTFPVGKITLRYGANETVSILARSNEMRLGSSQTQMSFFASSAEKMRIHSNGNVGIGTTSPTAKLHLADSASGGNPSFIIQDDARSGAAALNYISLTDSLNTNQAKIGYLSGLNTDLTLQNLVGATSLVSSSQIKITAGTNTLFENSGSEKMRITSTGNVGIGTTTPSQKLDVSGSIRTNSNLYVYNSDLSRQTLRVHAETTTNTGILKLSNGSNWGLLMRGQANNPYIGSYYNGNLSITGFEDSTGTSPSAIKLAQFVFGGTGGGSGYLTLNGDLKVNTNKKIQFGYANSQTNGIEWVAGSKISAAITPVDTANFSRAGLGFFTGDFSDGTTNAAERMRITRAGNVGIGTTSPGQKLQVSGNILATGNVIAYNGTNDSSVISALGTLQLRNSGNTNVNIQSTGNSYLNGGNVGIGTTSPTGKLDVREANVTISTSNSMSDGIRGLKIDGTNAGIELAGSGNDWWVSALGSGFSIYDTTVNAYRFKILNNGNVGIGTTSPSSKLDVAGDIRTSSQVIFTGAGNIVNSSNNLNVNSVNNLLFSIGGSEKMRLTSTGNVGIGTTSPSAQLHSNASGSAINYGMFTIDTDNWINFFTGTGTAPGASAAGQGALFWKSGGVLRLGTSTSTAGAGFVDMVRIDTDGNVGIGTTNPLAKLDITSTTDGVLLPRMTTTQVNAISSPENGLTVYNTTLNTLCFYNGSSWQKVTSANM